MNEIELEHFLLNSQIDPKMLDQFTRNEKNSPFPLRDVLLELRQAAEDYFTHKSGARMLALAGLRGIGKTTLMWQLSKEIYENYTQDIYFFNIEEFVQQFGDTKLYLIFQAFEKIVLKKRFHELEKPIVFLFDEVHDAKDWSKGLKILYDKCPRAFIISTGSSALLLHTNPDLATRWHIFRVFPFKFSEFIQAKAWKKWLLDSELLFNFKEGFPLELANKSYSKLDSKEIETIEKFLLSSAPDINQNLELQESNAIFSHRDLEKDLAKMLFFSKDFSELCTEIEKIKDNITLYLSKIKNNFKNIEIKNLLLEYVNFYNIPRFFSIDNKEIIFDQTTNMFEKILRVDVPQWLKTENPETIFLRAKKLLTRLAFSGEIEIESLARESGCKQGEVHLLIETLTKAEVLNQFLPYGRINPKLNKASKIFFMSPTLRLSLREKYDRTITPELQGILYEEIVATHLKRLFSEGQLSFTLSAEEGQKSPDFIIDTLETPIILEVKKSKKNHSDQISKSGVNCRYGIIVSAEAEDYSIIKNKNTITIPLTWFLLL